MFVPPLSANRPRSKATLTLMNLFNRRRVSLPWGSIFAYGLMAMLAVLALAPVLSALK